MNQDLVIFGAGGHAREVAQLVADINRAEPGRWNLLGFLADSGVQARHAKPLPARLLGDVEWLHDQPSVQAIVAVGNPAGRRSVVERIERIRPDQRFATLVHPTAWIANGVELGPGSVVFAGVLINVDVRIGCHGSINLGCSISHDCLLGDYVSLGPGVRLAGGVCFEPGVEAGTGAVCRPEIQVGAGAVIGAGAVLVGNPPPGCMAVGVPARWQRTV